MPLDRRELFCIVGAGVAGAPVLRAAPVYAPRALTAERYAALERMLDILLPPDESAPGAREAGVAQYLDTTLFHGEERSRAVWSAGIDALGRELAVGGDAVTAMERVASRESAPRSEAERFFVTFKQASIAAYYLSEDGRRSLGYHGDTAIHHFDGCTHPEHR